MAAGRVSSNVIIGPGAEPACAWAGGGDPSCRYHDQASVSRIVARSPDGEIACTARDAGFPSARGPHGAACRAPRPSSGMSRGWVNVWRTV
jgi:hypothetical protein